MINDAGTPLPETIRNRQAKAMVVHPDVVKVIAADLSRRNVETGNFEPGMAGDFPEAEFAECSRADFEIVIESFFFIRFGVNDGVVEGEGGLLGDSILKTTKSLGVNGAPFRPVANREHAHVFVLP